MSWFAWPLGLFALAAVPTVVALHLFRRRFEPRRVSALFLWNPDDRAAVAGRKLERLHRSPSFWLELLGALLLSLACASPRLPWTEPARHLVVVLDGSFSMDARREQAVAAVRDRLAALPRRSRATIVMSGTTPRLLAGPAALPEEAIDALANYQPFAGQHDLAPALALAAELAGKAATLLVSDDFAPDRFAAEIELLSVGAPLDNVGFTHAARLREGGEEKVFATVTSFARQATQRTLTIAAGATPLESRTLTLEPGARHHFSFTLPPGTPALRLSLDSDAVKGAAGSGAAPRSDALAPDDEVWLAPNVPRTVTLATTCAPALARLLQLASGRDGAPLVDRWCELVADSAAATPETAALVLGPTAGSAPGAWQLLLAGTESSSDAATPEAARKDLIGPFLIEKRHPLLRGLTLDGVVWSLAPDRPWSGAPLVCAGDLPLLTEELRDGARTFTLRLDARRSSLHRSPDWPILLANAAELRRGELPGPARVHLRAGEPFEARGVGEARFTARKVAGPPEPPREIAAHGTLLIDALEQAGLWRVERQESTPSAANGAAPVTAFEFAVETLDAAESDLRTRKPGARPSSLELAKIDASFSAIDAALLIGALALLLADWIWLSNRRHATAATPTAAAPTHSPPAARSA